MLRFNPSSTNSRSNANFSFQFIASYVWYSMENLAGDLLLGLKLVKLPNSPNTVHIFCSGQVGRIKVTIFGAERFNMTMFHHQGSIGIFEGGRDGVTILTPVPRKSQSSLLQKKTNTNNLYTYFVCLLWCIYHFSVREVIYFLLLFTFLDWSISPLQMWQSL